MDLYFDGSSIRYASPERLSLFISSRFCLESDKKSDLYSFSIIAYELTFSVSVWQGKTMSEVWSHVLEGNRPEITKDMEEEASLSIMKPFVPLMTWCWNIDPNERPSSFEAVQFLNRPVVPQK